LLSQYRDLGAMGAKIYVYLSGTHQPKELKATGACVINIRVYQLAQRWAICRALVRN